MSATLEKEHWSLHGGLPADDCSQGVTQACPMRQCSPSGGSKVHNPMSYRNYPCDSIVVEYFGGNSSDLDAVGEKAFKKQLWQCMMGQALEIKSNIETRRASNTFGITVWQYNEIWSVKLHTGPFLICPWRLIGHSASSGVAHQQRSLKTARC